MQTFNIFHHQLCPSFSCTHYEAQREAALNSEASLSLSFTCLFGPTIDKSSTQNPRVYLFWGKDHKFTAWSGMGVAGSPASTANKCCL